MHEIRWSDRGRSEARAAVPVWWEPRSEVAVLCLAGRRGGHCLIGDLEPTYDRVPPPKTKGNKSDNRRPPYKTFF